MKNKTIIWLIIIALAALGLFAYFYAGGPERPLVGEDGRVSGNYSLEQIMSLDEPYLCTFEKSDETSRIVGTLRTDSDNVYGEFRIRTDLAEAEFNSFLLTRGNESYTWTSLQPIGYKSTVASSASTNASPEAQAQIVGLEDEMAYECEPWVADDTVFEVPTWVNFTEL